MLNRTFRGTVLAFVILSGVFMSDLPAARAESPAPTGRIAVMSAYEPEWVLLGKSIEDAREVQLGGLKVIEGRIAGKEVVAFLTGVSMVNAAMTTQKVVDHYKPRMLVFSGIAGGVDPALGIGDVVVPEQWGQYLESYLVREVDGAFVPPSRFKPQFPNYGMIFPRTVGVTLPDGTYERRFWFDVDPGLLAAMRTAVSSVALEKCTTDGRCLQRNPEIVVGGRGVSGQSFVDNADFREYTFDTFHARILDMESAAVAHVARTNGVPFIAIRSLSDLAGGGPGENEILTFLGLAATNSTRVLTAFLATLP